MDNFRIRTDLALEEKEAFEGSNTEVEGVVLEKEYEDEDNLQITRVIIKNEQGAKSMGKPIGTYLTLESQEMLFPDKDYHRRLSESIAKHLHTLLPDSSKKSPRSILVAGLGNDLVTPDALGPFAINHLRITRHIYQEYGQEGLEECKSEAIISAFTPGVMAKTGIETVEIIKAVIEKTRPDILLVIDALAARTISRLNTTIQITDTGISPGYGVGNFRGKINEGSVGIPVIAIGVPTVIDAATIVYDTLAEYTKKEDEEKVRSMIDPHLGTMFVTPNDIDETIKLLSFTVAEGINIAFGINKKETNIV